MGDRVAVLNGGQIEQCDRPRDLYDRPANLFVAAFIGSPSMNFFTATVERRDTGLAAVVADVVIPLDPSTLGRRLRFVDRSQRSPSAVRAESITATPQHEASPQLSGTVEFVEELGSEVIVHTRVAGLGLVRSRSMPRRSPRATTARSRRPSATSSLGCPRIPRADRATSSPSSSTPRTSIASIRQGPRCAKESISERRSTHARHRRRHRRHVRRRRRSSTARAM